MKIGFYGHSNCTCTTDDSFITILQKRLNANIVNVGVRQGSEERILFELKKTKEIDLAVIFHSKPGFVFLPNSTRDLLLSKVSDERAQYLLFEKEKDLLNFDQSKTLTAQFGNVETFKNVVDVYNKYFYNPDAILNRYYGALMQIDRYVVDKRIPCIHVLANPLPNWLNFSTGVVDYSIMKLANIYKLKPGEKFVANVMNKDGNVKVADVLENLIQKLTEL